MSKLTWDEPGTKLYETGVEKGVIYFLNDEGAYTDGVAWNGLSSVSESPSGADESPIWADNTKYLSLRAKEEFGATIEAYMYPPAFEKCDGSASIAPGVTIGQQSRSTFGLCYKTILGNDAKLDEYGYKLHLIYGCTASPSERSYQTINDSPEAITFSWEITTVPVKVTNYKDTAILTIDSTKVNATKLAALEAILYGSEDADPRLPLPDEVKTLLTVSSGS